MLQRKRAVGNPGEMMKTAVLKELGKSLFISDITVYSVTSGHSFNYTLSTITDNSLFGEIQAHNASDHLFHYLSGNEAPADTKTDEPSVTNVNKGDSVIGYSYLVFYVQSPTPKYILSNRIVIPIWLEKCHDNVTVFGIPMTYIPSKHYYQV